MDGLRGFASLLVLFCHLFAPLETHLDPDYRPALIFEYIQAGHAGVLVFFALSGYVIAHTNRGPATRESARSFWARRAVRLVPLYLLACALGWLARPDPLGQTVGNLLFLQHPEGLFGLVVPPLTGNGPVWSLNYEVVYYLLFALFWLSRPPAWTIVIGSSALAAAAFVLPSGLIALASYATGFLFWLLGLAVAWGCRRHAPGYVSVATLLCFVATDRFRVVRVAFDKLDWPLPYNQVNLADLALLPVCLLLLLEASGRRLPGFRWFRAAVYAVPVACLVYQVVTLRAFQSISLLPAEAMTVLMVVALAGPVAPAFERGLIFAGTISYALYLLHRPIMWFVLDAPFLPSGSAATYAFRVALVLALLVPLAWWAERRFQPRLKSWLLPPCPVSRSA